jgi:hypothetical protein
VVTLCDSCQVRTESRFHFVVVTLCDSCEVRTESHFHFVVVTLCDSCEVRTESRFHLVVVIISLESREYGRRDPSRQPRGTPYPQKLALTSPTSGGLSDGVVRLRTKATE